VSSERRRLSARPARSVGHTPPHKNTQPTLTGCPSPARSPSSLAPPRASAWACCARWGGRGRRVRLALIDPRLCFARAGGGGWAPQS
jgi:hypothetical protein